MLAKYSAEEGCEVPTDLVNSNITPGYTFSNITPKCVPTITSLNSYTHTTMPHNKLFHNIKKTLSTTWRPFHCPVCNRRFKSRGGLTKHMNFIHPVFNDYNDEDSPSTSSECPGPSISGQHLIGSPLHHHLHSPPSSASSQSQSLCTVLSPVSNQKITKKHHQFRFLFHGGLLMSFNSINLQNATDQEDHHVHTDCHIPEFWLSPTLKTSPELHSNKSLCQGSDYVLFC